MPDVIRFGPNHVGQTALAQTAITVATSAANQRSFKTMGARLQFITRSLQAAGFTVTSPAMIHTAKYRSRLKKSRRRA